MDHILNYMRFAAEKGEAIAQFNLGTLYNNGIDDNGHDADRDRCEAIKWLRKAARQGLARAQSKLAEVYAEGSDMEPAYTWLLVAAANADSTNGQNIRTRLDRMAGSLTAEQIERANKMALSWTARIGRIVQGAGR